MLQLRFCETPNHISSVFLFGKSLQKAFFRQLSFGGRRRDDDRQDRRGDLVVRRRHVDVDRHECHRGGPARRGRLFDERLEELAARHGRGKRRRNVAEDALAAV